MSDLLKRTLKAQAEKNRPPPSPPASDDEPEEEVAELGMGAAPPPGKNKSPIDFQTVLPLLEYVGDTPVYISKSENSVIFLCVHGAGLSAASFAPLAAKVKSFARIASFDLPKHGAHKNYTEDADLSLSGLSQLTVSVAAFLIDRFPECAIVLVGHSLGGAVAARTVHDLQTLPQIDFPFVKRQVVGLLVIDVVEGSAIDALPFMKNFVQGRAKKFKRMEDAIEYQIKSHGCNSLESARMTTPPLFAEEHNALVWKTDLLSTEKWWPEWFKGLNNNFLDCHLPKLLILAHPDRMDKEMTIAQMQGKFKLVCFQTPVGHCLHEDDPAATAGKLKDYLRQFHVPLSMADIEQLEKIGPTKFNNGM